MKRVNWKSRLVFLIFYSLQVITGKLQLKSIAFGVLETILNFIDVVMIPTEKEVLEGIRMRVKQFRYNVNQVSVVLFLQSSLSKNL